MLLRKKKHKIDCYFCEEQFVKGTGHLCWCPDCEEPHVMCNDCYKHGKKQGNIVDKQVNIGFISEENKDRYT